MPIFLDSGNLKEIEKYLKMGIIRGVTTNPTILLKDGVRGGMQGIKERSLKIARLIERCLFQLRLLPRPITDAVTGSRISIHCIEHSSKDYDSWTEW